MQQHLEQDLEYRQGQQEDQASNLSEEQRTAIEDAVKIIINSFKDVDTLNHATCFYFWKRLHDLKTKHGIPRIYLVEVLNSVIFAIQNLEIKINDAIHLSKTGSEEYRLFVRKRQAIMDLIGKINQVVIDSTFC